MRDSDIGNLSASLILGLTWLAVRVHWQRGAPQALATNRISSNNIILFSLANTANTLVLNIHVLLSHTSAMLSIFGRAGAILLAVVDVSHALYA